MQWIQKLCESIRIPVEVKYLNFQEPFPLT